VRGRLRLALARLLASLRREPLDRDFDQEIESHLQMAIDDNLRRGMRAGEARRTALIDLGGLEPTRDLHRDVRGLPRLETILQDFRYAIRALRRNPGYATVVLLVLAVGIGANTTVFSVVDAILIRPLPFHEPDRLVWIENRWNGYEAAGLSGVASRVAVFDEWRARSRTMTAMVAYNPFFGYQSHRLVGGSEPERVIAVPVTREFFTMLGVRPSVGRTFTQDECEPNGPRAVLLTDRLWRRRFGADPGIVGQAVTFDEAPAIVAGVMSARFDFGTVFAPGVDVDLFIPLVLDDARAEGNTLAVVGRLAPGADLESARAEFPVLLDQIRLDHPDWGSSYGAWVGSLREHVSGGIRRALVVLWAAVGVVLLIACANLSHLLRSRGAARQKELAMRAALGAGRMRLVRQLLVESLGLASGGAAIGLAGAFGAVGVLSDLRGVNVPLLESVSIDGSVVAFTLACTAVTTLVFGLAPAIQLSRLDLKGALKEAQLEAAGDWRQGWLRSGLLGFEVALACTLVIAAGLLLRSFVTLLQRDPGFEPAGALVLKIDPPATYSGTRRYAFFDEVAARARAIPGVEAAGVTDTLPLDRNRSWSLGAKGVVYAPGETPLAYVRRIGPGYLEAMGVTIREGRGIASSDTAKSAGVVVVNETTARTLWPGRDPLGQVAVILGSEYRVVGVVDDVRHSSLEAESGLEIYLPYHQNGASSVDLVMRASRPPEAIVGDLRGALRTLDPTLPVAGLHPLQDLVDRAISPRRFFLTLIGLFAATGLVLAALGIYGVIAYAVSRRTREIGIRMALGATRGEVRWQVLVGTLRTALAGGLVGMLGALAAGRLMSSMLFGVTATDPTTFVTAVVVIVSVSAFAAYLPARRASTVDPLVALRTE
jgi:predicted permease